MEVFPEDTQVEQRFSKDPLQSLPILLAHLLDSTSTQKLTIEWLRNLRLNPDRFMWLEEVKLFLHILKLNENVIAFTEDEQSSLRDDYFSPYIIPVVLWDARLLFKWNLCTGKTLNTKPLRAIDLSVDWKLLSCSFGSRKVIYFLYTS